MGQLQELRDMVNEVKEILIEGYRQRGKDENAILIEQINVDEIADFVIPIVKAILQKENIDIGKVASL